MTIRAERCDPHHWNEILLGLPAPHPLQSDQWANHKQRFGWQPVRWAYLEKDQLRGAALLLRRRFGPLPLSVCYVPKGPLLDDPSDADLVGTVLEHLEEQARRERAVWLKIDPDVAHAPAPDYCAASGESVAGLLKSRGWQFSPAQVQFRNTMLLDLRRDEQCLLTGMKPKARYNLRLARKKGIEVRSGTLGELAEFYRLYEETSRRDQFLIREYAYYRSIWEEFWHAGMGSLLLAFSPAGAAIAGLYLFHFGRRAWFMYGASSNQDRELMPNYPLQWEAIRLAREKGCETYDLWGAPYNLEEGDPMWGVYRFKAGLGAELVRYIGAYDYVPSRLLYWIYAHVIPRYLAILRRRGGRGLRPGFE